MDKKKKILHIIKNIAYYSVTLFLIFVIAISLFIPNGLVKVFGIGWYRVVSESMEPLIMTGDYIVVIKDQDVQNFEDGDIIIFETHFYNRSVGTYVRDVVTHHFYKLDDDGYILTYPHSQFEFDPEVRRLDEWKVSETVDYRVKPSDIIGRHQSTIKVTTMSNFISSPIGISLLVIGTGLLIVLVVLYQVDKKKALKNIEDNQEKETDIDVENLDE